MHKENFFNMKKFFKSESKRSDAGQSDSSSHKEFQTLETDASKATRGHLNGYKEGTNVQRPTHHS